MPENMTAQHGRLSHRRPTWVSGDAIYFITICTDPRGRNALCVPDVAVKIWDSMVAYADAGKWWPVLVVLMPDHLHALMTIAEGESIACIVGAWKRYTAKHVGVRWQTNFFDHRLRHDESWRAKSAYVEQNPVRAGLVGTAEEWPYTWRMSSP